VRVVLTGGTGFIGAPLREALSAAGHEVVVVSRDSANRGAGAVGWDAVGAAVAGAGAVVNLAGEPIAARRWSAAQKRRILESRVQATRALVDAMGAAPARPAVFVSGSAVGYYGPHGDEPLDESAPAGAGFLAEVCAAWEAEALRAEALGVRTVRLRIGVVLAREGGALARMLPPFRAFVGGPLGGGRQWMSWIHRDDVIGLVLEALARETWQGAVNATAPQPVTNAEFSRALGDVLARPAALRAPAVALRLALGEMADMLLTGQRVLPAAATGHGFRWRYPDARAALRASVHR
jgi:uncharacterized protein (TIGR01777 family)